MTLRVLLDEVMSLELKEFETRQRRTVKSVLVCFLNHRDWRTGLSMPGVPLIAEEVGLSRRQVQRILRTLEQSKGAEKITPMGNTLGGQGQTTIYQLNLKGCVLGAAGTVTSRATFATKGDIRPDIRPDISSTRKTNKGLFTGSHSSHARHKPPRGEKRVMPPRSRFARAIANIDRICAGE